jgi:hypothetical protein
MPPDKEGHEIAIGWAVARVERHQAKTIHIEYLYLCQGCTLTPSPLQSSLFSETPQGSPP